MDSGHGHKHDAGAGEHNGQGGGVMTRTFAFNFSLHIRGDHLLGEQVAQVIGPLLLDMVYAGAARAMVDVYTELP